MKKSIFLLFFFGLTLFSYSQPEPLNQLDAKGKKNGKWIIYLDKNWKKVKDSSVAVFFRYNVYDHDASLYPMGPCGGKNYKLEVKQNGNSRSKFLDGEYKWFDAKGKLSSVHILKNGEYVSCKEYFPTGELSQHFDYTKKCDGQKDGWVVYGYDKKGNQKFESWMCKDRNGKWPYTRG